MWREIANEIELRPTSFRGTDNFNLGDRRSVTRENFFNQLSGGLAADSESAANTTPMLSGDDRPLKGLGNLLLFRLAFFRGDGVGKFLPDLNDHARLELWQVDPEVFLRNNISSIHW